MGAVQHAELVQRLRPDGRGELEAAPTGAPAAAGGNCKPGHKSGGRHHRGAFDRIDGRLYPGRSALRKKEDTWIYA